MKRVSFLISVLVIVLLASEANCQTRTIEFGSSDAVLAQKAFTFRAVAGSKIQIRLDPGFHKGKPLSLALHAPKGSRICEATRSGDVIEISTCTLPADGTYTIIARCEGVTGLFLACLTGNCAPPGEPD